jgi:Mg2+ and Co2+ transporter CorA
VEDVLQQEPREKVDVFERLGYYFVVVRALDERYFRYTSGSAANSSEWMSKNSSQEKTRVGESPSSYEMKDMLNEKGDPALRADLALANKEEAPAKDAKARRPRVDLIEGLDGKEGVEGVSVGAVNIYLVIFSHGVISVSLPHAANLGLLSDAFIPSSFTSMMSPNTQSASGSVLSNCRILST